MDIQVKRCEGKDKMIVQTVKGVTYLTFPRLQEIDFIDHLFSTRLGGVSKGCYSEMNLSYTRGDEKDAVDENYRRIADVLGHGRTLDDFVLTFQTHTTNVMVVKEKDRGKGPAIARDYTDIDGLVTNVPGIILGTFHADCPPIYFVDPVHRAIGLSHSGWKGTKGNIAAATLAKMKENYGTEPSDCICAIGPSICGPCYEIGEDVAKEFSEAFTEKELMDNSILVPYPNNKYRLYLWNAIKLCLMKAGVKEENISVTDVCTRCNPDFLFSHRVHHDERGNLCAFLSIRE
ncbi:peptidoglycan editing factor PgeF [Butyrivibrio sp. DSM 10294]|uniref:peptidoglycan editing factor PgeF n=1 Tax=Butyrivibrio sp. DSM 10294 TaxID=2972457 RepID=UPI00234F05AE|nr:peptidoglycan editing factor PgeF [Butyrivibrio sp. DSM 10294]MDC7295157.1 peptidoglycan editing factor PgeF [Butyrivibrio sp. DSM 10294]